MKNTIKLVGSPNIIMFGAAYASGVQYAPANDNQPEETEKTLTIRKKLDKSGVAIKIKVPVSEYYGVAVSTIINEEGALSSEITLVHNDEELNYRVYKELGNQNVVAEWQNWGKKLRLPLFIKSGNGELMPYSQQVDGVLLGNSNQRKKAIGETSRRPRFLNRRK